MDHRRRAMHRVACLVVVGALAAAGAAGEPASAAEAAATPPPIFSFFRNPDIGAAKLSPSGKWLAITTANKGSRVFLVVIDTGAHEAPPRVVASYSNVDIRSFEWVNDERLVYNTIDTTAPLADQRFGPGLFAVGRDGSGGRMLIRPLFTPPVSTESSRIGANALEPSHELIRVIGDGSDDVIVGELRIDNRGEPDWINPKRLDVATGRSTSLAAGAPPHVVRWLFDRGGHPRVAMSLHEGKRATYLRGPAADAPWLPMERSDGPPVRMVPVSLDDRGTLYVETRSNKGFAVLKRFDTGTGKLEADALVSAPGFDLDPSLIIDPDSSALVGVRYRTDAEATTWFDPAMKRLQAMVDARFPGHVNRLTCARCLTDGVALVQSYSDQDPGSFWLYRQASDAWDPIGSSRSGIDPTRMAQVDFVRIRARDGEDLPVWVTRTKGDPQGPRPAVVLVHGGPWVRGGTWAWHPEAQFLASRGYVVIEPEFRGSLGYGSAHFTKGFRQWGLRMQDDLVDATRWAAEQGMIDSRKVCIAGASYGGYATLMGLVRDPDVFKCGVAWVAVTDPRLLYEPSWQSDSTREVREFTLPARLGDPVRDAAYLKDAAPVEHAKEIRSPLLMAFGGNDRRVPLEHGTRMRDAMAAAGLRPEFVVYEGEGHGFLKVDNNVDFWTRVERFLARQLD